MNEMQQSDYKLSKDRKGWVTVTLHVMIWLMVFLIPYIFSADIERDGHHKDNHQNQFLYLNTALNFFWVVLFYLNARVFIPRFIYKRKTLPYVLALACIFCLVVLLDRILFTILAIPRGFSIYHSIEHNLIPFLITVAVSAAYKAISDKTNADIQIREKESEHLKTELSFLRSQISPHFLFNVLNNIAALARIKSDDLEPTVIKLSSLMRYMLYETDEDKVIVKNEVEYLQDYIDLQRQRYGDELTLQLSFDIKEEWQAMEPMLLVPFVENAFKHGGGLIQHPEIQIHLKADNNKLHFSVKNKYQQATSVKDKTSGIGLANVKRRLELLYPDRHNLVIEEKDGWFTVSLELILK